MTATGHALVGAAIASQIANPIIGLPLSLASHFLGDKLPHWDPMTDKATKSQRQIVRESILDVLFSYLVVFVVFILFLHAQNPLYIFASAFTAQLPDWIEMPYSIFKMKVSPFYEDYQIQKWIHHIWFDSKLKAPWGVVTQVVVIAIFLLWALQK